MVVDPCGQAFYYPLATCVTMCLSYLSYSPISCYCFLCHLKWIINKPLTNIDWKQILKNRRYFFGYKLWYLLYMVNQFLWCLYPPSSPSVDTPNTYLSCTLFYNNAYVKIVVWVYEFVVLQYLSIRTILDKRLSAFIILPNLKILILIIKEKWSQKYIILPKLYIVILEVKYVKSNINAFQNLKGVKTKSYLVDFLEFWN